jgi:hypothetical protein
LQRCAVAINVAHVEISVTVAGPSAEEVAAYYIALCRRMPDEHACTLTGVWLKAQIEALTERLRIERHEND